MKHCAAIPSVLNKNQTLWGHLRAFSCKAYELKLHPGLHSSAGARITESLTLENTSEITESSC